VITIGCAILLVAAALAHEPSDDTLARRRIRQWKRERLQLPNGNRRR
jgi:hypothetical protein